MFDLSAAIKLNVSEESAEYREVPIERICTNALNFYSVDNVDDLEDSIRVNGLLSPVGVFEHSDGSYLLFSGHRRFKAVRRIYESSNFERFKTVPCMVYPDPHDPVKEELMLIHANSTSRILSPAETARQAARIKELLVKMREAGADLPGRLRDIVAAEMQISKSKLARLEAIRNNLRFPGWVEAFEKQDISESVAYEIQQLDYDGQCDLWDWVISEGLEPAYLRTLDVKAFAYMLGHECPEGGDFCPAARGMYLKLNSNLACAGCCKACKLSGHCSYAHDCPHVKREAADPKETVQPAAPVHETEGTKRMSIAETFGRRLKECREAASIEKRDLAFRFGYAIGTYSAWENGTLAAADNIAQLAQALDCTTDYLLGLSDTPKPVSKMDTSPWQYDAPPVKSGDYLGRYGNNCEIIYYDVTTQHWHLFVGDDYVIDNVRCWMPIPEEV